MVPDENIVILFTFLSDPNRMNTPPTMSAAPLPMAPVKSNKKQVIKPNVKPKKLLYNEQDFETPSKQEESVISSVETLEIEEKMQSPVKSKRKELPDPKFVVKHVEQNELDTESEQVEDKEIRVDHPYNLRRRNKTPVWQITQQVSKKKIVKPKFEAEKENIQVKVASTTGNEIFSNQCTRSDPNIPNSLSRKDSSSRGSFTHLRI